MSRVAEFVLILFCLRMHSSTKFLLVSFIRIVLSHFTNTHHFGFEAAAWYWHFVDVVWLFLFVTVYWWGGMQV